MSVEIDDIDDIEFERLLADKRHKEVSYLLKNIATALSKDDDKDVIAAINKQGNNIPSKGDQPSSFIIYLLVQFRQCTVLPEKV